MSAIDARLGPRTASPLDDAHTAYAIRCPDGIVVGYSLNWASMEVLAGEFDTSHLDRCRDGRHVVVRRDLTAWVVA